LHYYLRRPLCICWYIDGRYREVIDSANTAIASAQQHGDVLYEARLYNTQGLAYRVLGEYHQAMNALTTSQHLYERLDHPEVENPTANLASLFHYLGREQQALAYFEHALALGQRYQIDVSTTTAQLGDIYLEREDFATALDYYRSAITQLETRRKFAVLAVVLANAAVANIRQNQLGQAGRYLQRALSLIAQHPHKRYNMIIHYSLGLLQQAQRTHQDARTTLENALQQAQAIGEKRFQTFIHEALAEVYAALGDMAQAFSHERHFAKQQQALLNQKHQRQLAGLMLEIEIEREQQAREQAEYALKVQTELLERITDGFLAIDKEGVISYANPIISDLSQVSQEQLIGNPIRDAFPHLPQIVWQHYHAAISHQQMTTLEFFSDSSQRWYDLRIYPSAIGTTVYLLDISKRKQQDSALKNTHQQLEQAYAETAAKVQQLELLQHELENKNYALERLSQQDGLTKLFNRRMLDTLLDQEYERSCRHHTPLSVMLCDIDNFKQVNDGLSHAIGDDVLRQIAVLLSQNTRNHDIVARYGGEEFVIVFPETSLAAAARACEHLRHLVATHPWHTVHPELTVTLSMGVSERQSHFQHYETLLQAADAQMYRAKTSGKNRVCFVADASTDNSTPNQHTEDALNGDIPASSQTSTSEDS
jgi:diguanylate cyclase (GGDEF)-like protein